MPASAFQYLGLEQVAHRLGLEEDVVQSLLETRAIPGIRLGSAWLVPEPELDRFLEAEFRRQNAGVGLSRSTLGEQKVLGWPESKTKRHSRSHAVRLSFRGREFEMPNYAAAAIAVIEELAASDATFLQRFASVRRGKRRYVALKRDELYFNRPDLPARQLKNGWWIGTNYSRIELERMLANACKISGLRLGADLVITPADDSVSPSRKRAMAFVGIARDLKTDVARRHDEYFVRTLDHTNA